MACVRATLDKVEVDLKRKVADAVEQVRPLIEACKHRLEVHMPPESAFAWADRRRVVRILVNLLNDAAKYTLEGGNIVLAMEVRGEQVALSVSANGICMTPEQVARAFELFALAERSSNRSQGVGRTRIGRGTETGAGGEACPVRARTRRDAGAHAAGESGAPPDVAGIFRSGRCLR